MRGGYRALKIGVPRANGWLPHWLNITLRSGRVQERARRSSGKHRRIGFDRNDFGTQRDQRGGQLAGSGAEVEHSRAGRGLERPARRGLGVVRPVLSVGGRRYPERRRVK